MAGKIKIPFPYFGNKDRFYKEIKQIFEENYRDNFVDLFAGGMAVPLNLKNDFSNLNVLANVKDEQIEVFIKLDVVEIYKRCLDYIYPEWHSGNSGRELYNKDQDKFNQLKYEYGNFFSKVCPCCHKRIGETENSKFTNDEKKVLSKLMSFGGKGHSLSNTFYSESKMKNLEIYLKKLKEIKITTDYFDGEREFKDSFIFLDPPYIQTIKNDENQNFIGLDYTKEQGANSNKWTTKDDKRLVEFIKRNINKNNVFLIFGSKDNNLSKLLKENFNCNFTVKEYRKNYFGKVRANLEWFCLIKD